MNVEAKLISGKTFAGMLSVSMSHFYELKSAGRIGPRPIRLGRSTRYKADEVSRWIACNCPALSRWQQQEGGRA